MVLVRGLIWDDWNRKHLTAHDVIPDEVEEVWVAYEKTNYCNI